MNLNIKSVRGACAEEWDSIWRDCDYATFFHSREWATAWKCYSKQQMQPEPKLITFSDGRTALLPLSVQKSHKGLVKNYFSSAAGTYGGWLSTDDLGVDHAILLAEYLQNMSGSLLWRLNPYDILLSSIDFQSAEKDSTSTIRLTGDPDPKCPEWTKKHRSAARKAEKARKAGVEIRRATSLEEWREYFCIYKESLQRWGDKATSNYSYELFESLYRLNSDNVRLWVALYENKLVAGALCFYAKNHAVYWHGAAKSEFFNLRPVNLLMFECIRNARENGYTWFDLSPSGGHEGVEVFKRSLGAESLPSNVVAFTPKIVLKFNQSMNIARDVIAKVKRIFS